MSALNASSTDRSMAPRDVIVVQDPEDGTVVGEVLATDASAVEAILETGARTARARLLPAHRRAAILETVARQIEADPEPWAKRIALEGIKTIREARIEVGRCANTLRLSAEEAKHQEGAIVPMDQVPAGEGRLGLEMRRPAGLILAITPFNDPLNLVAHKLGPAIAVGAPIILKPASATPLSAQALCEALWQAGLPDEWLQLAHGGRNLGDALVSDSRPRLISFTGGREGGMAIARSAGRGGPRRLAMELGGVGVTIVDEDTDIETAAAAINSGAFWAAGQNCVHTQRVIVVEAVADALEDRLVSLAESLRLEHKLSETSDMGPLINKRSAERLNRLLSRCKDEGAAQLCGGGPSGTRMPPTWLRAPQYGTASAHCMAIEEAFGPLAVLERASDFDDALGRLAAAGDAINASLFTQRLDRAFAAFEASHTGTVIINDSTDFRIDAMPFGGPGNAGLGREGVSSAAAAMTESHLAVISGLSVGM